MTQPIKKPVKPTQAWICTKCGRRRGSLVKPPSFGCTVAASKQHTWVKAN